MQSTARPASARRLSRPQSARISIQKQADVVQQANPAPRINSAGNAKRVNIEANLSTSRLHELTGASNLQSVTELAAVVDTKRSSLGHFGTSLPNLFSLTLTGSTIPTMRDLGTSLSSLRVLYMGSCQLADLRGVASLSSLEELYLPENAIVQCSPISMLEHLKTLDLRCNLIADKDQLGYLGLCSKLINVSLMGNPFYKELEGGKAEYHAVIHSAATTLETIDSVFDASIDTSAHRPKTAFPRRKEASGECASSELMDGGATIFQGNILKALRSQKDSKAPRTPEKAFSGSKRSAIREPAKPAAPQTPKHRAISHVIGDDLTAALSPKKPSTPQADTSPAHAATTPTTPTTATPTRPPTRTRRQSPEKADKADKAAQKQAAATAVAAVTPSKKKNEKSRRPLPFSKVKPQKALMCESDDLDELLASVGLGPKDEYVNEEGEEARHTETPDQIDDVLSDLRLWHTNFTRQSYQITSELKSYNKPQPKKPPSGPPTKPSSSRSTAGQQPRRRSSQKDRQHPRPPAPPTNTSAPDAHGNVNQSPRRGPKPPSSRRPMPPSPNTQSPRSRTASGLQRRRLRSIDAQYSKVPTGSGTSSIVAE